MNKLLRKIPLWRRIALALRQRAAHAFPGSELYWEQRYHNGGNSGNGSYGKYARFKAEIINGFVLKYGLKSVIEFGCGDGNQLKLANYPYYVGFDVSESAVSLCRKKFSSDSTREFHLMKDYRGETADVALSLDVIYHLVEDSVFENYMAVLFAASDRYVIIYSSNFDSRHGYESLHVKHRKFTGWISTNEPSWKLLEYHPGNSADFYIYEKN